VEEIPVQITPIDNALTESTLATVQKLDVAINQHDLTSVVDLMSEDTVWENTYPSPDGERYEGRAAVQAAFEKFFHDSPRATFEVEEIFAAGERAVVRWRYRWVDPNGVPGHVRGVDLVRVRAGKVVESLSYVKG
jgi:ketosteroid isomerase-like protein